MRAFLVGRGDRLVGGVVDRVVSSSWSWSVTKYTDHVRHYLALWYSPPARVRSLRCFMSR